MITFPRLLINDLRQLRWYTVIAGALITAFAAECAISVQDYTATIDDVLIYSFAFATAISVVFACAVGYSDLGSKRRAFLLSKPVAAKAVIFSKYISGLIGLFLVTLSPVVLFWIFALATGTTKDFWQLSVLNSENEVGIIIGMLTLIFMGIYSFSFLFTVLWHQPFYAGLFGLFITGVTISAPFILPIPGRLFFSYILWLVPAVIIVIVSISLSIYATRKQWSMGIGFKGLLWTIAVTIVIISTFIARQIGYIKPAHVFEFSDLTTKISKTADNELTIYPERIPVDFVDGKITFPKGQPAKLSRQQYNEKVSSYYEQLRNDYKSSQEKKDTDFFENITERTYFYVNNNTFLFKEKYIFRKKADAPKREKNELTADGICKDDYKFDKYVFEFSDINGNVCSTLDMTVFLPEYCRPENPYKSTFVNYIYIDEEYKTLNTLRTGKQGQLLVIDIADPLKPNITEQHKFPWTGIMQNNYPILPFEYISGKERILMSLRLLQRMGTTMTCYTDGNGIFQISSEYDPAGFRTLVKEKVTAYDDNSFVLETVDEMRTSIFNTMIEWQNHIYRNIIYSDGFIYCFVDRKVIAFNVRDKGIKNAGHFVIPPLEELISIESVGDGYIAVATGIPDMDCKCGAGELAYNKKIYTFKAGKGFQPD